MKKLFLLAAIAVFGLSSVNAQSGFNVGLNIGLPIGDAGDVSSASVGFDANYLFEVSEQLNVGPALGFTNSFGKSIDAIITSIDLDDVQFLPVAAAGRFLPNENMYVGADLGYAVGIDDGNDGGI